MSKYFSTNTVQAPVVYVEILGTQFGLADLSDSRNNYDIPTMYQVPPTPKSLTKFPNLIVSLEVERIIDTDQNIYKLVLKYTPDNDEDPSYLDKLISACRTQNDGLITIAYGDASEDGFLRDKNEVLLTTYTMSCELETSTMTYTIEAVTKASAYYVSTEDGDMICFDFPERTNTYVSTVIREIYNDSKYKLQDAFPGGIKIEGVDINDQSLIDTPPDGYLDETVIQKAYCSPISYLKQLVKTMFSADIGEGDESYSYVYSYDDSLDSQSFCIERSIGPVGSESIESISIGLEDSPVISYEFTSDFQLAIAVKYGESQDEGSNTKYFINDDGEEVIVDDATGEYKNNNTEAIRRNQRWLKSVSNLPYGMYLKTRGLKRQLPMMSNIDLTVVIKGQVHYVSGTYYITAIKDYVDSDGYVSEIELIKRVESDKDDKDSESTSSGEKQ